MALDRVRRQRGECHAAGVGARRGRRHEVLETRRQAQRLAVDQLQAAAPVGAGLVATEGGAQTRG